MAKRIRRGTLTIGTAISNVSNMEWNDQKEFDRSQGDNEFSGTPIEMKRAGSGTFTLLAGSIPSGYATSDPVLTYNEVSVVAGVETVVTKSVTFTQVTVNQGGSVPAEGKGEKKISFDYATSTEA